MATPLARTARTEDKAMKKEIIIEQKISLERVYDLLVSALEGGSNYWYMIQRVEWPKAPYTFTDKIWSKERETKPDYINQCEVPFNEGGALLIDDENADRPTLEEPVRLDLARIEQGLKAWSEDAQSGGKLHGAESANSSHWADFLAGNDDINTADIFLQYCIFGKAIYG